jgi:hypothetical protein
MEAKGAGAEAGTAPQASAKRKWGWGGKKVAPQSSDGKGVHVQVHDHEQVQDRVHAEDHKDEVAEDQEEEIRKVSVEEGSLAAVLNLMDLDGDGKVSVDEAMIIAKLALKEVFTSEHYAALREGFVYMVFLVTFLVASLLASGGADSQYMKVKFTYTEKMHDLLVGQEFRASDVPNHKKTFEDILTPEDAWFFLEGPLLATLYPPDWCVSSLASPLPLPFLSIFSPFLSVSLPFSLLPSRAPILFLFEHPTPTHTSTLTLHTVHPH